MFTGETCPWTHFILAEILVLAGGTIPLAPAVPASTRISARLKRVQEHSSPVDTHRVRDGNPRRGKYCLVEARALEIRVECNRVRIAVQKSCLKNRQMRLVTWFICPQNVTVLAAVLPLW